MAADEIDKFEQKEKQKIRPIENTWYELINYIPESMRKSVGEFKDKNVSFNKTNSPKKAVYGRGKKLCKPKTQNIRNLFILKKKKIYIIIRNIWTLFETEEEKRKKEIREKRGINNRLINDRIIRDIKTRFEQEVEDYYKPKTVSNLWNNNYIEYGSNGDKNRILSLDEYLNKIKSYLSIIIIDLKNSDEWQIQLTITITLFLQKMLKGSV